MRRKQTEMKEGHVHEPTPADVQEVRAALNRAARRINILELIVLGAAAIAALAGGWLVALLAERAFGYSFRRTWAGASIALFVVPAVVAVLVDRRRRGVRAKAARGEGKQPRERGTE